MFGCDDRVSSGTMSCDVARSTLLPRRRDLCRSVSGGGLCFFFFLRYCCWVFNIVFVVVTTIFHHLYIPTMFHNDDSDTKR